MPVEGGRDIESCIVTVHYLLRLVLGSICGADNAVRSADLELVAFLRDEVSRTRRSLMSGVELIVTG